MNMTPQLYKWRREYREAQRDVLYAEHGENWRKFERNPGRFWHQDPPDDDERAYLERRVAGRLD